jgi:hypothetical protein
MSSEKEKRYNLWIDNLLRCENVTWRELECYMGEHCITKDMIDEIEEVEDEKEE